MIGQYAKSDKDCLRACLASILEVDYDSIPEVDPDLPVEDFWKAYREVFNKFEYEYAVLPAEAIGEYGLKVFSIGLGKSGDIDHAVVCYDGKIVHDPSVSKMTVVEQYVLLIPMFPWKYKPEFASKNSYIGEVK